MIRRILPAVLLVSLVAGCGSPADLTPLARDLDYLEEESRAWRPDRDAEGLLAVADERRARADSLNGKGKGDDARLSMELAVAAARTARAAAFADVLARRAESCEGDAAEVMREWEDSVRMLERTEQVAGVEARGVTRELPAREREPLGFEPEPHPYLDEPTALALLDRADDRLALARLRKVPAADLHARWVEASARAAAEGEKSERRAPYLFLGARAVQELEYRLLADDASDRCRIATQRIRDYDRYRAEALWGLVEIERGLKEGVRAELDEERARMAARQEELYESLQQFQGKFAQIRQDARGTIMSLGDITFAFGKASLQEEAKFSLVKVATILAQFPEMHIYVEGHTDDIGSEDANQKLSERRAQVVFEFMHEHGVPLDRMDWYGYGETRPAVPNDSAENRQKNRRVDLVIREEVADGE
jgi:outer membrane protein OmpA-like peptidoglycan-associated protein